MAFARTCFRCGTAWGEADPPRFHDLCPGCGRYLHVCRNCRAYEWEGGRGVCISPTADPPLDATAQNFCEEFDFVGGVPEEKEPQAAPPGKGAEAFRRLFGG